MGISENKGDEMDVEKEEELFEKQYQKMLTRPLQSNKADLWEVWQARAALEEPEDEPECPLCYRNDTHSHYF